MDIEIIKGDITKLEVDAIVNAANPYLAGGGGVDGAIHRAAGIEKLHEACRKIGGCNTGDAVITEGFNLSAKYIIHTVGPIWQGGTADEAQQLASCYRRCFELCEQYKIKTIAFPAISCGVYGYPYEKACKIAVDSICSFGPIHHLQSIVLIDLNDAIIECYKHLLADNPYKKA